RPHRGRGGGVQVAAHRAGRSAMDLPMTTRIQLDRSGPLATLWLDRPDKRNALDAPLMKELAEALDEIGADRATRVVLVRGRGPVFSSGIDHTLLTGVFGATQQSPFLHLHHGLQDV